MVVFLFEKKKKKSGSSVTLEVWLVRTDKENQKFNFVYGEEKKTCHGHIALK